MGVFGNFTKKVQEGGKGAKGEDYVLNEVLTGLDMANNGVPRQVIADLLKRSKDSLNYKLFEKQTTIKGKTQVRSVLKYMYKNPAKKQPDNFVDEEVFLKKLFKAFGEEYKGPEDIEQRILTFCEEKGIEIPEGDPDAETLADELAAEDDSSEEAAS